MRAGPVGGTLLALAYPALPTPHALTPTTPTTVPPTTRFFAVIILMGMWAYTMFACVYGERLPVPVLPYTQCAAHLTRTYVQLRTTACIQVPIHV